jgi:hypothetical protein
MLAAICRSFDCCGMAGAVLLSFSDMSFFHGVRAADYDMSPFHSKGAYAVYQTQ